MITVKKREAFLQTIAESFIVIYKRINQIETVTVTSVNPLEQTWSITTLLELMTFFSLLSAKKDILATALSCG